MGWMLALVAFLLCVGTWVGYMARVPSGRVPERPWGSVVAQVVALGAGVAAVVVSPGSALAWGLSGFVLVMSGLFLGLLTQRKTPVGSLRVAVGDALLPFSAKRPDGSAFSTAELAGQRTLLKFFRGGW